MDNRPIGMFDSGVGGITVLSEVRKKLKNENVVYLGDTKRFPYGSRSRETIIELTKEGIEFLISKNVKAIVIACGTATSQSLEEVKFKYDIPIIGIIDPTVRYLEKKKDIKRVGVIATKGTIRSNGWENNITDKRSDIEVINKACPLLAPMAEEGWVDNEIAKLSVKEYIKDMKNLDAIILGCTHFPLFTNSIREILGEKVEIINTGTMISSYLEKMINEKGIQAEDRKGDYEVYLTDTEGNFVNVAGKLLQDENIADKIKRAEIEKAKRLY